MTLEQLQLLMVTSSLRVQWCVDVGGGWRRIININISADDYPGEWRSHNLMLASFCTVANDVIINDTCSSASFSTNGLSYQRVCGRARGYQKGFTLECVYGLSAGLLRRDCCRKERNQNKRKQERNLLGKTVSVKCLNYAS